MKRILFLFACISIYCLQTSAQESDLLPVGENEQIIKEEKYRRSSLCLIFLTHQNTQYAAEMEREINAMAMPDRYNEHNVTARVISVTGRQNKKQITNLLNKRDVARRLVSKWFNRNEYTGQMDMSLIHERGGYSASYEDLQRANMTERGVSLLLDEGSDLLQSTFVLVCDMSYFDNQRAGQIASAIFAGISMAANAYANQQEKKGNKEAAKYGRLVSLGSNVGSLVSSQIGGFAVKMNAYLYQLKWDNSLTEKIYNDYWIDENTSDTERQLRKAAYMADNKSFQLEYLGFYRTRSNKVTFDGGVNQHFIIGQVCKKTLEIGMVNLARQYPQFKVVAPIYRDDLYAYSYIGTKEGMTIKSKYDVVESKISKKGIKYKKVGQVRPRSIWNNSGFDMTKDRLSDNDHGSIFNINSGNKRIGEPGLLVREHNTRRYKRWFFNFGLSAGWFGGFDSDRAAIREQYGKMNIQNLTIQDTNDLLVGFNFGATINFNTYLAWNLLDMEIAGGRDFEDCYLSYKTGLILRTRPLGSNNKWSFFIQPCIGWRMFSYNIPYSYTAGNSRYSYFSEMKEYCINDGFDYQIKVGVNVTRKFYIAGKFSECFKGATLGFNL